MLLGQRIGGDPQDLALSRRAPEMRRVFETETTCTNDETTAVGFVRVIHTAHVGISIRPAIFNATVMEVQYLRFGGHFSRERRSVSIKHMTTPM